MTQMNADGKDSSRGNVTRSHSAAEPQPKNDRIMAGQNDREMNEGKQERDPVLISQKVTKKG